MAFWRDLLRSLGRSTPAFDPRGEQRLLHREAVRGRLEDLSGMEADGPRSKADLERSILFLAERLADTEKAALVLDTRNEALRREIDRLNAENRALVAVAYAVDPPTSRPYIGEQR